jgi:hypothetical protein
MTMTLKAFVCPAWYVYTIVTFSVSLTFICSLFYSKSKVCFLLVNTIKHCSEGLSFSTHTQKIFMGIKFKVFWDVASCSHVEVDWRFRCAYCIHRQNGTGAGFSPSSPCLLCQHHSTVALHTHISHGGWTSWWPQFRDIVSLCEISSSHGGEYEV